MDGPDESGDWSAGERGAPPGARAWRSPVTWAILGLVLEKPSYGYEIAVRFDRRFSPLMSVSPSNIYTTLDRLVRLGFVERVRGRTGTVSERQRRQHYKGTADGARAYREWLAACLRDDPRRTDVLVRLSSICMRGPEALLDLLDRYEVECVEETQRLAGARREAADDGGLMPALIGRVVESERRLMLTAQLQWVQQAKDEVRRYVVELDARRRERGAGRECAQPGS